MRLRHIKGAEEEIAESPYVIQEPKMLKGRWHTFFKNENPIHIEIGMGKGKFLMELAAMNPLINYVGIERYSSVLLKGLKKREESGLSNSWFMRVDARELADIFDEGEVDRIYLNFSDPWPKDRHTKRRLTSDRFLAVYDRILKKDGVIEFKTDNQELFQFSLESIEACRWRIREKTFDLHHSAAAASNVMTEYETRFVAEGKPICRLVAFRGE
ncbi:MAG: tRNA (guanosine(46)-N7)-methyltransferase TrmB [Lachnospiraceae bacterium]|nr:tRNA (guanosine(46)-N7)-methyltransferase TrmB [Lachnospiraceae bacterium]